jgi:hypothetical protein
MSAFEKGHKKLGGRKKGSLNRATESIKNALNGLLSEEELVALWKTFLHHRNPHIAFEAFKLAQFYMFGKPVRRLAGEQLTEPIKINISAIPLKRELVPK